MKQIADNLSWDMIISPLLIRKKIVQYQISHREQNLFDNIFIFMFILFFYIVRACLTIYFLIEINDKEQFSERYCNIV